MFKKILVCLDGTTNSERILPYAIDQALHFSGKLILMKVNALSQPVLSVSPEQPLMDSFELNDLAANKSVADAQSYLTRIAQNIEKNGIDVEVVVSSGPVAESITKFVKHNKIDLIAMTHHAYRGWKRLVRASMHERILNDCETPILVVSPEYLN